MIFILKSFYNLVVFISCYQIYRLYYTRNSYTYLCDETLYLYNNMILCLCVSDLFVFVFILGFLVLPYKQRTFLYVRGFNLFFSVTDPLGI
jgi:hypothetical protein